MTIKEIKELAEGLFETEQEMLWDNINNDEGENLYDYYNTILKGGYLPALDSSEVTAEIREQVLEQYLALVEKYLDIMPLLEKHFKKKMLGYHSEQELDEVFREHFGDYNNQLSYQNFSSEIHDYLSTKGCAYITSYDSNWRGILVYREQDELFIESIIDNITGEASIRELQVPFYLKERYKKIYNDQDETIIRKRDLRDTLKLLVYNDIISLSEFKSVPTPTLYRFKDGGELNHKNRTALKKELLSIIKSKSVFF